MIDYIDICTLAALERTLPAVFFDLYTTRIIEYIV